MSNVTSINRKAVAPQMSEDLEAAVSEQQTRVFELRSVLRVCEDAFEQSGELTDEDVMGCMGGLKNLADVIYSGLSPDGLLKRAAEICEERQRNEERS